MECNDRCNDKLHVTQRSYLNHRLNGKEKNGEIDKGRSDVDQRFASSLSVSSDSSYASVITSSQFTDMQSVQEFGSIIESTNDPNPAGSIDDFDDFKSPESSIIEHYYKEYEPLECDAGNLLTDTEVQCKVREYEAEQMYGSSEIDSDMENKLFVQNMKNCEYEMYRKIHSKNRYNSNSSSNSSSYVPTDLESVSDTTKRCFGENTRNKQLALYNGCFNNKTDKQKYALKRQTSFSNESFSRNSKQVGHYRKSDTVQPLKTNRCESLKRITITISTKQTAEVSESANEIRNSRKILSDSDEVTDSTDDLTDTESLLSFPRKSNAIDCDQSSYVTSGNDLSDKESESFLSSVSVTDCKRESESDESKYFDCSGNLDETVLRENINPVTGPNSDMSSQKKYHSPRSSSDDSAPVKIPPRRSKEPSKRSHSLNKSTSDTSKPMICIVQELSQNKTISSTVHISKEQVKIFQEKRSERKNDNESDDKVHVNGIRSPRKHTVADRKQSDPAVIRTKPRTTVKDDISVGRLESSPKYTGKLIGNLLAKRLERAETMSSVRRSLLQNLTFTVKENNVDEKKLSAIPPIKPPRSFTASSASSPKSKQSVTSSATIPIEELDQRNQHPIGFLSPSLLTNRNFEMPKNFQLAFLDSERSANNLRMGWIQPTKDTEDDSRITTHLGWVQPTRDVQNESGAPISNYVPTYLTRSNQRDQVGFRMPKENIDTVDNANTQDFERFSANLNESPHNHLSTPIKESYFDMQRIADLYDLNTNSRSLNTSNNRTNSSPICDKCLPAEPEAEPRCKQCNGKIKRSPKNNTFNFLSNKRGKKIGRAALKRTRTIIGASKQFLVKPKLKKDAELDNRNIDKHKNKPKIIQVFEEPTKDLDNTARFNSNTYSSHNYQKTMDKSLNLTAKHDNIMAILSNPEANRKRIDENFHKFPPSKPIRQSVLLKRSKSLDTTGNSVYNTPNTTFNFERIIQSPPKVASVKKSPSKLMTTLRVLTKPPKKIFFGSKSNQFTPKSSNKSDVQNFYRSYQGNEMEQKVPLISELLMSLKQNVEDNHDTDNKASHDSDVLSTASSSARRKLFEVPMSSSEDILDESRVTNQVTEVELHDEPEPIYAEIPALREQEHQLADIMEIPHITIDKKPNVVYAVVNRNRPKVVNNVEKSGNTLNNSMSSIQSYESLNLSVINDFAQSIQNLIQNQQTVDGSNKNCNANSQQSGSPISDISSGCSAFDFKNFRKFGTNSLDIRMESDVISSQSGSYCESLTRGNDLNGEIKTLIQKLESVPSDFHDSEESFLSQDKEHEYILVDNRTKGADEKSTISDGSLKNGEIILNNGTNPTSYDTVDGSGLNTSLEYATPISVQYSDSEASKKTPSLSSGSKDSSPNYKAFNRKIRNSLRKGKDYFRNGTKKLSNHFEKTEMNCDKDDSLDIMHRDTLTQNQRKQINQIFELLHSQLTEVIKTDTISQRDENLIKVINKISRQQEVRHQLRNALHICRITKEFQHSAELVESERLMLISHLKEWAGKLELVRISALKDDKRMWANKLTGAFAIRQLEFFLNQEAIYDTHFNHFYMCVCSYRDQIECTSAKERNGNRVVFNDCLFKFTDIEEDFEIRVEVYVLRLRKSVCPLNGDAKQKSNKNGGKKSLTATNSVTSSPSNSFHEQFNSDIDVSRYRLRASTSITRYSLFLNKTKSDSDSPSKNLRKASNGSFVFSVSDSKPFIVTPISRNSNLKQCIQVTYECIMTFDGSKLSGFLNMASGKWSWNRLWCEIDGICLKFWTYPQDSNDLPPVLAINLKQCVDDQKIEAVDRETCPRARAFAITINADNNDRSDRHFIKTHFIATDTNAELERWLIELNRILIFIRNWNL